MGRDRDDNGFGDWGGYMDAKISKLEEQFAQSSDPFRKTNLFAGISIYVNGLTNPSSDDLKRIMMTNGGVYHHYERKHTTYIIASNLPDVKIRNMDTSKIISPQWILDCLNEKRILDYTNYLLYTNRKKSQPELMFFKKKTNEDKLTEADESCGNIKETVHSFSDSRANTNVIENNEEEMSAQFKLSAVEAAEFVNPTFFENEINGSNKNDSKNENIVGDNFEINQIIRDLNILNQKLLLETSKNNGNETITKASTQPNTMKSHGNTSNQARTANDPKFLSEFYNNSRLHHIATLGASFKQYITQLRDENKSMDFPNRKILKEKVVQKDGFICPQSVMHIDMDCFFVSVGLRKYPNLRGKPVAVTHSKGGGETVDRPGVDRQLEKDLYMKRLETKLHENIKGDKTDKIKNGFDSKESLSEIASCSYEAREMGIKNGMFVGQALKLCPQLKTIPYDFDGYKEVATSLYNIIAQYTLNIEAVSCDEMFVDLTELLNDVKIEPMDFVRFVREEVRSKTGCPCSAGVGANRLQARMATKKAKPDGQYFLDPETVEEYMSDILIKELPGVGYSTSQTLKQINLFTCGDLQKVTLAKIQCEIGKKFGETLYQFCRGIDNKPLVYGQIRKSVSAEVNYGIRFKDITEMETFLKQLCGEVHSRLMETKRKGKCLTLKLMTRAKEAPIETAKFMGHGYCDQQSKSITLSAFTDSLETITRTILATMKSLCIDPRELRGIGIQISKLEDLNDGKSCKNDSALINMFNRLIDKQRERKIEVEMPKLRNGKEFTYPASSSSPNITDNITLELNTLKRTSPETSLSLPATKKKCVRATKPNEKKRVCATKPNEKKRVSATKPIEKKGFRAANSKPKHNEKKCIRTAKSNPEQNLRTLFEKVETKKPTTSFQYKNVDLKVFAELPKDIQREILKEYKAQNLLEENNRIENAKKTNLNENALAVEDLTVENLAVENLADENLAEGNLADENLAEGNVIEENDQVEKATKTNLNENGLSEQVIAQPEDIENFLSTLDPLLRKEVEKDLAEQNIYKSPDNKLQFIEKEISLNINILKAFSSNIIDNIFLENNFNELLKAWISSNEIPSKSETDFLCESVVALIENRKICDVYQPIVQFHDIVNNSKKCAWHSIYREVIKRMQMAMRNVYGARMLLNETINCDQC